MAGKELNERVVNVQEGDGEVIDREEFDYFKENMEEGETKQPKQKPEVLVTVIKKINLNNGRRNEEDEEKHGIYCYSNDEDDEIEEGVTEEQNEKKNMMNLSKSDVKEMAIEEEDTNVEIERVAMEETMWEEKMEESLQERKEKKGFLKKIMEKWT
ncbi:hypothetical protein IEQ34_022010 [Dendrobium chrysotoxum]|uniref:Uncharacterized protein n=1 Tax=Dendrobium chrysotoxum TaxID=161865 RepID=A0AAV7FWA4_DENCH|nr:hypothetical protein IEQ34_022010 [Dendrobium chrysotoxum]